jgi:hypothetical protein
MPLDGRSIADEGTFSASILNDVFMSNDGAGPSSTDEFADLFVPIFITWFETAVILVTGPASYTNISSGATVAVPGGSSLLVNSSLLLESDLKIALKEDLVSGTSDIVLGGIAAKGWPLFSEKVTQNIATQVAWSLPGSWTASDIQISGGSCFSFLFAFHETESLTLEAAANDLAAALYSGILSYTVSSAIGARHVLSDAAVDAGTLTFVTGAAVAAQLE